MKTFLISLFFFDFWVLQLCSGFTLEDGAAVWESSCFVGGFSVQFAFIVSKWQWTAIFDELEQSTNEQKFLSSVEFLIKPFPVLPYFGGVSSETAQVERPQNGANSQVLPGSTVAHRVLAKHIPGKSKKVKKKHLRKNVQHKKFSGESSHVACINRRKAALYLVES